MVAMCASVRCILGVSLVLVCVQGLEQPSNTKPGWRPSHPSTTSTPTVSALVRGGGVSTLGHGKDQDIQVAPPIESSPVTVRDGPYKVMFYVPNIIGYIRIGLMVASLKLAFTDWEKAIGCYTTSFLLDAADGHAARMFHQTSKLGVMLDMITDRCATAVLLVILARLYPRYFNVYVGLMVLDIASHWSHMIGSVGHHKQVGAQQNLILRLYYGVKPIFVYSCLAAELFYITMYMQHYMEPSKTKEIVQTILAGCIPGLVFKQLANLAQLFSAMKTLAVNDWQ